MPTYQYRCTECGDELEAVQKFTDPSLTECPSCEGRLRKIYNAVGVVFKGSGFYRTDSRNDAKPTGSGASTSDASTSDASKSDGKSEGKSDGGTSGDSGSGSKDSGSTNGGSSNSSTPSKSASTAGAASSS